MSAKIETKALLIHPTVELKRWIEQRAAHHFTSQSSEVIRILREKMAQEQRERAVG
jgi:hypothetical protein